MKKNKTIIIGISITALFLVIFVGVTYSLWSKTLEQSGNNRINSTCFNITFEEVRDSKINLENTFPMTDRDGEKLKPYHFKIKNNCDAYAKYDVVLEVTNSSTLDASTMKVKFQEENPSLLNSYQEVEPTLPTTKKAYILESWYLNYQEEKEYDISLWIDENVTQNTPGAQNASWGGIITVKASYLEEALKESGILRTITEDTLDGMWKYRYDGNLTKIVFQNKLEPIENAIESFDESKNQDGSVMSYIVENEDSTKTAYLQSNNKIVLETGEYTFGYFFDVVEIEGFENLDTKNVTNMSNMFSNCMNLVSLDLSSLITNNVTNMSNMFSGNENLTSLNLSNWSTNNVTDMSYMFSNCISLIDLDLSSFRTNNMIDMSGIFFLCTKLTNLNISNFDTSKVTNMTGSFSGCSSLTRLDLSHLKTPNLKFLTTTFQNMENLEYLNLSGFNTFNVETFFQTFMGNTKLTTIVYGENFVNNLEGVDNSTFRNCPANKPTHESWNNKF